MSLYDVADEFGNWQDDKIWSLGAQPAASQDAYIAGASDFRVTSDDSVTVNSVGVASGDELEISGGSTLTATEGTVLASNDQGHSSGIDGIVGVDSRSTFSVGDTLANSGMVFLGSPAVGGGATRGDLALNGAVALTGDGVVELGGETTSDGFYAGNISGGGLSNLGNTIEGIGLISVASLTNTAGDIIASRGVDNVSQLADGNWLIIRATTFTNDATLEISSLGTLDLGSDGATLSLTNNGTINIGYNEGFANSGADATLVISGNYAINGSGHIDFGGDDALIVSDLSAGDTFTNGAASSIHANFTGEIGNGAAVAAAFNLTFDNYGDVFATGAGVTLTINTGANTVYDLGGLLEADDNATLVIDSPVQMGQYYILAIGSSPIPGGTIEATSGGTVEINSTVANGPPPKVFTIRQSSGEIIADAGSTVVIESGGSVAVPIQINGASGGQPGGVLSLDAGGAITGAVTFDGPGGTFNDSGAAVAINGYVPGDAIAIGGLDPNYAAFDPHSAAPPSFTLSVAGDVVTQDNSDGSQQITTYAISGQTFTQEAIDIDAKGEVVAKYFSGVTNQGALSAFEYLYAGNSLIGTDEFYAGISGEAYAAEETDYNGAGQLTRAAFSALSPGSPYSAYEYDYVGGVFEGSRFAYANVPAGASYTSYEVDYDQANAFAGEKFLFASPSGASYANEEEDFDANVNLSRIVLTGVSGEPYYQLELDYDAGAYSGYKAFCAITGQAYTNEEFDVSAAGQLEKVDYSGLTGTPYQTVEQDYSGGALAATVYGYQDVTGQTYNAFQVAEDANGVALSEVFDLNSGGHLQIALASGQTLTGLGGDKMTGSGATTFALDAIYGADLITNFNSDSTLLLPAVEYAEIASVINKGDYSGGNAVLSFADGDTLTFKGLTQASLEALSSHISSHA